MLRTDAVGLFTLTIALAVPVPLVLARLRWTGRDPRAALVCWQAVGLSGGLSLLGAALSLAASNLSSRWLPGIEALPDRWQHLGTLGWCGLILAAVFGLWLATAAASSTHQVLRARRRHRAHLDTVTDPWPSRLLDPPRRRFETPEPPPGQHLRAAGNVRLLDHPVPVAYCLPGLRPRIVISQGAVLALDRGELDAVLAHERAHARGRHDLLVQPFLAWQRTFPFLSSAARALNAVQLLVEMLADDSACRRCSSTSLQGALKHLSDEPASLGAEASRVSSQISQRTARLASPVRPLPPAIHLACYLAAVLLVAAPPAILILT